MKAPRVGSKRLAVLLAAEQRDGNAKLDKAAVRRVTLDGWVQWVLDVPRLTLRGEDMLAMLRKTGEAPASTEASS